MSEASQTVVLGDNNDDVLLVLITVPTLLGEDTVSRRSIWLDQSGGASETSECHSDSSKVSPICSFHCACAGCVHRCCVKRSSSSPASTRPDSPSAMARPALVPAITSMSLSRFQSGRFALPGSRSGVEIKVGVGVDVRAMRQGV